MGIRRWFLHAVGIAALSVTVAVPTAATPTARTLTLGGIECNLIAVGGPLLPVGTSACPGVRPGALITTAAGSCSLNFLFKGGDGHRYVGTAGHCILGEGPFPVDAGERLWSLGTGPIAYDGTGKRIGRFAYAILEDPKDFALIRLDRTVPASPAMCYFGGPVGINTSRASEPVLLHHFGNGLAIGDVLPARTSVANTLAHPDFVFANGVAMLGDSGSGVIDSSGKAVGVLVTVGAHMAGVTNSGFIGITRLKPQLDRAASKLRIKLTLQKGALAS